MNGAVVFLGLGSNVGDRHGQIAGAVAELERSGVTVNAHGRSPASL